MACQLCIFEKRCIKWQNFSVSQLDPYNKISHIDIGQTLSQLDTFLLYQCLIDVNWKVFLSEGVLKYFLNFQVLYSVWSVWCIVLGSRAGGASKRDMGKTSVNIYPSFHVSWMCVVGVITPMIFNTKIQIWWKFNFCFIHILGIWLSQNFAHAMTAVLLWHVQNFVTICQSEIEL